MEDFSYYISEIIKDFDFTFCIITNILTYCIIKCLDDLNGDKILSTWTKRGVLISVLIGLGIIYYALGSEIRILVNSAVLAPVFWSWVIKPICKKLDIDYKQIKF